jgi:hypothetical protein
MKVLARSLVLVPCLGAGAKSLPAFLRAPSDDVLQVKLSWMFR